MNVNTSQSSLPEGTNFIVTNGAGNAPQAGGQPDNQPGNQPAPHTATQPTTQPTTQPAASPASMQGMMVDPQAKTVEPNTDTSQPFQYEPTGDAGLDYALDFIGKLGYSDAHPAVRAAITGDFSLIRAELSTRGVQGADAVVKLAEDAHARFAAKEAEQAQVLQSYAHEAAGGEQNWDVVRAWASKEATPAEKADVNAALAKGGMVAKAMIRELVHLYKQSNTLPQDGKAVSKTAGTPASNATPLTAQAYAQAVDELYRKLGPGAANSPEYAQLQKQRLAARRAGI